MELSSKLLQNAVEAFSSLPGIGKRSALRLALFVLKKDENQVNSFAEAIKNLRANIKYCSKCHNLSDTEICSICSNTMRDDSLLCVVESIKDIIAIEETGQYRGYYHVLGGIIDPLNGIGPEELNIESLLNRTKNEDIEELIMAISPTIEGDTTIFYLTEQLKNTEIKISTIARGVSFGGELEYADGVTLGRSIMARTSYKR